MCQRTAQSQQKVLRILKLLSHVCSSVTTKASRINILEHARFPFQISAYISHFAIISSFRHHLCFLATPHGYGHNSSLQERDVANPSRADVSFGDGFTMFQQIWATSMPSNKSMHLWILLNQPLSPTCFCHSRADPNLAPVERKESRRSIRAFQETRLPCASAIHKTSKGSRAKPLIRSNSDFASNDIGCVTLHVKAVRLVDKVG